MALDVDGSIFRGGGRFVAGNCHLIGQFPSAVDRTLLPLLLCGSHNKKRLEVRREE